MEMVINYHNIFIYFAVSCALLSPGLIAEGYLGLNWGRMATQRMIPSMIVDVLLQNNISDVRMYSASKNVLEAFAGTGIQVSISIPNFSMKKINTTEAAENWIAERIINPYLEMNITFRYLYVGTAVYTYECVFNICQQALWTLKVIHKALEMNNITGIEATFCHATNDILTEFLPKPSMAEFKPKIKDQLIEYSTYCKESNAPFGVEIFPLVTDMIPNNDIEFSFFENNSSFKFWDGDFFYANAFEVMYDSIVCALEKIGFPDLQIVVGSVGWPTDGKEGANVKNAERFHQGLAKFIRSQKGTPRRPGNIDVYIQNIADENTGLAQNSVVRHFGIYKFDGQPKFNLDFTGNERKVKPVSAVGITRMPKRWCILDTSKINPNRIPFEAMDSYYNNTCLLADCTSNSPGGSCSDLPFPLNYSYGFNAGFQASKQNLQNYSCDFGGYGILVFDDPSTPACTFPIEIIAAETTNFLGYNISPTLRPTIAWMVLLIVSIMY